LVANVEKEKRECCISCGITDFISTPILPETLATALCSAGEILDNESYEEKDPSRTIN
jgi:CheY-like chemotaxis protein